MKNNVRMYHSLGIFLRNEFTNVTGKPRMIITPLLLGIYEMRAKLRQEAYAKEWLGNAASVNTLITSSKIKIDKTIMIVYLPLIHISMLFMTGDDKVDVIPCQHQFITAENDYDPASIYFYRMACINNEPTVLASCKYSFCYEDIVEPAGDNITYGYLVAAYVDMLEAVLQDIDDEYKIIYRISPKENCNYDK